MNKNEDEGSRHVQKGKLKQKFATLIENDLLYENGKKESLENYLSGKKNGIWEKFNDKGTKIELLNYKNSKLQGEYRSFYDNGKLKETDIYYQDKKDKIWKYFDENEKVIKEEIYKKGTLVKQKNKK